MSKSPEIVASGQDDVTPDSVGDPLPYTSADNDTSESPNTAFSLENLERVAGIIVGVIAILYGTGFIVVNLNLMQYTTSLGVSINSERYIAAAVIILCFTFIYIFIFALFRWFVVWVIRSFSASMFFAGLLHSLKISNFVNFVSKIIIYYVVLTFILATFMVGMIYYPAIPQSFGGGLPVSASFVFTDLSYGETLGLRFIGEDDAVTEPLLLLAEVNNGYLVYDELTSETFVIISDHVLAIMYGTAPKDNFNTFSLYPAFRQFFTIPTIEPTATTIPTVTTIPALSPTPSTPTSD